VAALAVAFIALGVFGNGVYGTAMRGLVTSFTLREQLDNDRQAQAVENALDTALSLPFIQYHHALYDLDHPTFDGAYIRHRISLERATYGQLHARGRAQISPPPPQDTLLFAYDYYDVKNFALHLVGPNDTRDQAFDYLQLVLNRLDELISIEAYKLAHDDEERIAVLDALRSMGVPVYAEWIARALNRFRADGVSAKVAEKLDALLAWTKTYIEAPTMRGLPADTSVEL
jgi:hypothetical protein